MLSKTFKVLNYLNLIGFFWKTVILAVLYALLDLASFWSLALWISNLSSLPSSTESTSVFDSSFVSLFGSIELIKLICLLFFVRFFLGILVLWMASRLGSEVLKRLRLLLVELSHLKGYDTLADRSADEELVIFIGTYEEFAFGVVTPITKLLTDLLIGGVFLVFLMFTASSTYLIVLSGLFVSIASLLIFLRRFLAWIGELQKEVTKELIAKIEEVTFAKVLVFQFGLPKAFLSSFRRVIEEYSWTALMSRVMSSGLRPAVELIAVLLVVGLAMYGSALGEASETIAVIAATLRLMPLASSVMATITGLKISWGYVREHMTDLVTKSTYVAN